MRSFRSTACSLLMLAIATLAADGVHAQMFSARRMAMGGVVLRGGGGLSGANVAYRAVPPEPSQGRAIPLPLGLVQVLSDPPQFDASQPDFNAFELANLLYQPPWNVQLGGRDAPSSDISVSIAQNSLLIDMAELHDLFPENGNQFGSVTNGPGFTAGFGDFTAGLGLLIHDQVDMNLNNALHAALAGSQPFVPNTEYRLHDDSRAQAAAGVDLSYARALYAAGKDPRAPGGAGLYAGARAKLLRGLAYGDVQGGVGFTTPDTLFGNNLVRLDYDAIYRTAAPSDGGIGYGLDLGAVWVSGNTELGLGLDDVATRIHWKTRVREAYVDTAGNQAQRDLAADQEFTSKVPLSVTLNATQRLGPLLLAADAVRGALRWTAHVGAEQWLGQVAVRGGLAYDQNRMVQASTGAGMRFGRVGVDLALSSNSNNVMRERVFELGAGLVLY